MTGPAATLPGKTTNYPRNCWWVAGFQDEITREPTERWMLDRSVLLYRREDGRAVALENRCAHRWAPLSTGTIIGDRIQCRYHGFEFDSDGHCVNIPTQENVPMTCRVQAYPVLEAAPFIWVWMGDPDRIDDYDAPPDTSWYSDPALTPFSGVMEWNANYMMLHENVLDLSHFGFLHANTFGIHDITTPPTVQTTETQVTMRAVYENRLLPPLYAMPTGISPDRPVHFVTEATFLSPALHEATETIRLTDAAPGERDTFTIHVLHATTPISMDRMRYYFVSAMDFGLPPPLGNEGRPAMGKQHEGPPPAAFVEDKDMIESIWLMMRQDSRGVDYPEIAVRADAAGIQARRKLAALMERDQVERNVVED